MRWTRNQTTIWNDVICTILCPIYRTSEIKLSVKIKVVVRRITEVRETAALAMSCITAFFSGTSQFLPRRRHHHSRSHIEFCTRGTVMVVVHAVLFILPYSL